METMIVRNTIILYFEKYMIFSKELGVCEAVLASIQFFYEYITQITDG